MDYAQTEQEIQRKPNLLFDLDRTNLAKQIFAYIRGPLFRVLIHILNYKWLRPLGNVFTIWGLEKQKTKKTRLLGQVSILRSFAQARTAILPISTISYQFN